MIAFLAVTLWAVIAWALETLNDVAVGIILPILYVLFCGVTKKVVFAPWLSEVPIIVIGGFTLGKIIQVTGLGKRIALTCVKLTGGSFSGALAGITLGAVIVAPLVPSIMGKAAIFCAVAISLCDALDFKPKSREATAVVLGTCIAVGSTKLAYLTGAGDLVMGMGLADKVMGTHTTWLEYAKFNFPPAMLYTAMSLGIVLLVLRSSVNKHTLCEVVRQKHAELGCVTDDQKRALILLCLTLLLLSTDKLHGLSAGTVLVFITALSFLPGISLMPGTTSAPVPTSWTSILRCPPPWDRATTALTGRTSTRCSICPKPTRCC
jgi:Di- and tricarboxylate transporters